MKIVHLALAQNGMVLAHFVESKAAADFCRARGLCHVPYSLVNRESAPAPLVGAVYRV